MSVKREVMDLTDDRTLAEPPTPTLSRTQSFWAPAMGSSESRPQLGNRRVYAPPGRSMRDARAQPYASGRDANANHPNSTNPAKYWLGTYFCTPEEQAHYSESGELPEVRIDIRSSDILCWRGQWEQGGRGDKANKLHVQFAVCFADKVRVPQARRILGGRWGLFTGWLNVARSDTIWDYVQKEETRVAVIEGYGDLAKEQGKRSDLDYVYEKIAQGASIYDVMDEFPRVFMKNHAAISKLCAMYDKPRPYGDCHVEIWWGVTGSGKSHAAYHTYPDAYRKTIPGKWWEGYRGQDTVIFEEFNPDEDKELRLPELLKILDKYPYQVEVKGASMQLKANRFIITTNIDPRLWYQGHPQQPALCRRIAKIKKYTLSYDQQQRVGVTGVVEYVGMTMPQQQLA